MISIKTLFIPSLILSTRLSVDWCVEDNLSTRQMPIWGPVTANGVDLLTEMYVIYMERDTSQQETVSQMEGRKARKYIMIYIS